MRVVFAAQDFQSGIQVIFKLYRMNGNLIRQKFGTEVGTTGVYYADFALNRFRDYIVTAEHVDWQAFEYIPGFFKKLKILGKI